MYRSLNLAEDNILKQVISDRFELASTERQYDWRATISDEKRKPMPGIIVTRGEAETQFSLEDVADAIGDSLTDLLVCPCRGRDIHFLRRKPQVRLSGCTLRSRRPHRSPRGRQPPPPLRRRSLPPHRESPPRKRSLRRREIPRIPPFSGKNRPRRRLFRTTRTSSPPHPPQWQRSALERDQDRDRRPQSLPHHPLRIRSQP